MRRFGSALVCLLAATPAFASDEFSSRKRQSAPAYVQTGFPVFGMGETVQPRQVRSRRAARVAVYQQAAPMIVRDDRYAGAQSAATAAVAAPSFTQPTFAPAAAPRERVATGAPPSSYASLVSRHAAAHGIPESLVHRVIMRESRYNPRAVSKGNYGMMQIRLGTARAMGYRGSAAGLLDADTNMTYAVKYLAGAYRVAGGNPSRAVGLYASGYYYHAKRRGITIQQAAAPSTPVTGFAMASTDGFAPAETVVPPRRRGRR